MPFAAFIAASPDDSALAQAIRTALETQGFAVAGATEAASPSQRAQAIADSRCVVALVSGAAETSDTMRRDVVAALNNARPILPVLCGDVRPEGWLRLSLDDDAQIDVRGGLTAPALAAIVEGVRGANAAGRVLAMLNIKGGVGKTVLAANLFAAAHLASQRSIVFVDLDPQHNLSQYFLPPVERNRMREDGQTLHAVFQTRGEAALPRSGFSRLAVALNRTGVRQERQPRLDLVVGDERLFEHTLDVKPVPERDLAFARFHALIQGLRARYDAVVIDTNPCATFLTRCAVANADHIVAPVRPERYSLTGLGMLEWVTREIRERPLKPSEFSVLINGVGDRVRSRLGDVDAQTRNDIALAPFFGQALVKHAIPYSGLLRATPDDRYAVNPINVTAVMRLASRGLKEALVGAAAEILGRAGL